MFSYTQLRSVHIEITSRCQASCPMCSRNIHGGSLNPNLVLSDWSILDFKRIFNRELLQQLTQIKFCGNYGDPVINKDLIDMCSHIKENNPNIIVVIHTNGGIQTEEWWKKLAQTLPKFHGVVFGIDGVDNYTNNLYRIGVNYDKVIRNARTFISNGGTATWQFIMFKHNKHQIEEAEKISKEIGFYNFYLTDPVDRFGFLNTFEVLDKDKKIIYYLEKHDSDSENNIDPIKKIDTEYKNHIHNEVLCYSKHTNEIYIDSQKNIRPCCFIPQDTPHLDHLKNSEAHKKAQKQSEQLLKDLGNTNLSDKTIKDVLESKEWQLNWDDVWNGQDRLLVCAFNCMKIKCKFI